MTVKRAHIAVFVYKRTDQLEGKLQSLVAFVGADVSQFTMFIDWLEYLVSANRTAQGPRFGSAFLAQTLTIVWPFKRGLSNSAVAGVGGRDSSILESGK